MRRRCVAVLLLTVAANGGCSLVTAPFTTAPKRDPPPLADYSCGIKAAPVLDAVMAAGVVGVTIWTAASISTDCGPNGCWNGVATLGVLGMASGAALLAMSSWFGFKHQADCKELVACYRGDRAACVSRGLNPDGSQPLFAPVKP